MIQSTVTDELLAEITRRIVDSKVIRSVMLMGPAS